MATIQPATQAMVHDILDGRLKVPLYHHTAKLEIINKILLTFSWIDYNHTPSELNDIMAAISGYSYQSGASQQRAAIAAGGKYVGGNSNTVYDVVGIRIGTNDPEILQSIQILYCNTSMSDYSLIPATAEIVLSLNGEFTDSFSFTISNKQIN